MSRLSRTMSEPEPQPEPLRPAPRRHRRCCDVCGSPYWRHGQCALAPVRPRSWARRRDMDMAAARAAWDGFQLVLVAYADAVQRFSSYNRVTSDRRSRDRERT